MENRFHFHTARSHPSQTRFFEGKKTIRLATFVEFTNRIRSNHRVVQGVSRRVGYAGCDVGANYELHESKRTLCKIKTKSRNQSIFYTFILLMKKKSQ